MNGWKKQIWICLLLAAGSAILYWPVTGHSFIGFDDNEYLVQNWHIHSGVTWRALGWAFGSGYASNWHPLTWISHMIDWQFFGANPAGHHFTNLIIHAVNGALLFVLLRQMTGATWRSAFVAGLFAWHPLHVESVAWAAERKDVLSAFFWIVTMMAYTRYTRGAAVPAASSGGPVHPPNKGARFYYALSLALFACALMSKPMAVTLPFVLLLVDFWPLERAQIFSKNGTQRATLNTGGSRLIEEKLPFFLLALIASIITFKVQQAGGAVNPVANAPLSLRFENAFVAYAGYVWKTICPAKLAVLYPLSWHLPIFSVLGAAFLFLLVTAAAFLFAKRVPYLTSGWLWFAGVLVPVIGVVQVGSQSMADRYTYIPSIGLFIVIAWGAVDVMSKVPKARSALAALAVAVLAVCLALTRHQLGYWQNGETLFRHAIAVTDSNYLAYASLSSSLNAEGRTTEAIQCATDALRMQPNYPEGHYNLGTLLLDAGKTDDAIDQFEVALKQNPRFADAENNLGKAYQTEGKLGEAAAHLAAAHSCSPNDPEILYNLGSVLLAQSKLPEAAARFAEAIQIDPDHADAHGNLGVIMMQMGQTEKGTHEFAEKVRLKPNDAGARLNYGLALLDQQRPAEAAAQFNEVLRLQPDSALGHYRLGLALATQGKSQDAIVQCREALRLQPDFPDARQALEQWTHGTN